MRDYLALLRSGDFEKALVKVPSKLSKALFRSFDGSRSREKPAAPLNDRLRLYALAQAAQADVPGVQAAELLAALSDSDRAAFSKGELSQSTLIAFAQAMADRKARAAHVPPPPRRQNAVYAALYGFGIASSPMPTRGALIACRTFLFRAGTGYLCAVQTL